MANTVLENKAILITGGTGSLGTAVVRRIDTGEFGKPKSVIIFSRDELKQSNMAKDYPWLKFVIGDVRDYKTIYDAIRGVDIIIHVAALKRVGTCEKFPDEAVATNYWGASNIVRAIKESQSLCECVVGISSDKGVEPLNVYGTTKALQEKRLMVANDEYPLTRFVCVRYGNVVGSRGSVIPIWLEQIKQNKPITVTDPQMTRFFISLDIAVDTIIAAITTANRGEVYVPANLSAAYIGTLARVLSGGNHDIKIVGKNIGEKMHETLITKSEVMTTTLRDGYFVVTQQKQVPPALRKEYVSSNYLVGDTELMKLMQEYKVLEC